MRRQVLVLLLCTSCSTPVLSPVVGPIPPDSGLAPGRKLIDTLPIKVNLSEVYIARDGRHAGYCLNGQMVVDGIAGETFDGVSSLKFSDDGNHWGYVARLGKRHFTVLDGKANECPGEPDWYRFDVLFRKVPCLIPRSEPDRMGRRQYSVLIDGRESRVWRNISIVVMDDRCTRTAYFGESGKQIVPVIDGVEGEPFDAPRIRPGLGRMLGLQGFNSLYMRPTVSRDGKHVGYIFPEGSQDCLVLNGVKGPAREGIGGPFFSDDGRIGTFEKRDGKWRAVVDGTIDERFEIGPGWAEFSSNLNHVVWREEAEGGKRFVFDGVPGDWFHAIDQLQFSPDGRHHAYVANNDKDVTFIKGTLYTGFVVHDGKRGKAYDQVYFIKFSPDSNRLAYTVEQGGKRFVVCDQNEWGPYDEIGIHLFSDDSRRHCFAATRDGKQFIVVDGIESETCDKILGVPRFSRDGRFVGYGALKGQEVWWNVVSLY